MPHPNIALILGAGSGVGRATALLLAETGYHLALAGRTLSKLEETAGMVEQRTPGLPVVALPAELTDPAVPTGLVEDVVDAFDRVDVAVNCAGFATLAGIGASTPALWRKTIDSNLSYVVHLTAALWPVFQEQKGGLIVNVSSMSSIDPFPGLGMYAAAKGGLNLFTLCTAREGAALGVRAVAVAPGAIETPMLRSLWDKQSLPAERTLDPSAVGAVIRDLITGARPFTSGETIVVPSP